MGHNLKLSSFKSIFASSYVFYKSNWKTIVLLFLPLEIATLFCFIALDLIPETDFFFAAIGIVVFNVLAFLFSSFSKIITLDAPYLMERIAFGEKIPATLVWYKSLIKRIIPIALVLFLIAVANFGFISITLIVSGVLFVLISMVIKYFAAYTSVAIVLHIALATILIYGALRYIIKFFIKGMFSIYMYIFDKRTGLDAVVSSFLLTEGRELGIFLRSIGIWLITLVPFLILVLPINGTIIFNNLSDLYFQVMILHQEPIIPSPGTFILILLDVMSSLSALIGVSFFVVLNYFLWRDIKATAGAFEEVKYQKTRKYVRSLIGFGVVLFVAILAATIIVDMMAL